MNEPRDHIQEAYDLIEQVRDKKNWKVSPKDGATDPFDRNFEWVGEIDPDLFLSLAQSALDIMRQRGFTMHKRFFIKREIQNDREYYFAQALMHDRKWAGHNGTYVEFERAAGFPSKEEMKKYIDEAYS